jgi:hypothetical protein
MLARSLLRVLVVATSSIVLPLGCSSSDDVSVVDGGADRDSAPSDAPSGEASNDATLPSDATSPSTAMVATRWAAGSGPTLVSNGIPLPPGRLTPNDLGKVRVLLGGVEQSIYVEALKGTHPDGSLRSILVQFTAPLTNGSPVAGELRTGETRTTTDVKKTPISWEEPAGVFVPTSPDYIIATDVCFKAIQKRADSPTGPGFDYWEHAFVDWSWYHWNGWSQYTIPGADDGFNSRPGADYYDRAMNHFIGWARGVAENSQAASAYGGYVKSSFQSNPARPQPSIEYLRRGLRIALDHAEWIIAAKSTQPNNFQPNGLAIGYLLSGDERFVTALSSQHYNFGASMTLQAVDNAQYGEGRIQERSMLTALYLGILGVTTPDGYGRTPLQAADYFVKQWLTIQRPDGQWSYRATNTEDPNSPLGQSNFMEALRCSSMILWARYRAGVSGNPTLADVTNAIKKQADFLWNTQWIGSGGKTPRSNGGGSEVNNTFRYHNTIPDDGEYFNNAGINADFPEMFAWVGWRTGDKSYVAKADTIFNAYVADMNNAFYAGSKQYNEQFLAQPYLWYRVH